MSINLLENKSLYTYIIIFLFCYFIFRAEASASLLAELNPYVTIQTSTTSISSGNLDFLKQYQVHPTLYISVLSFQGNPDIVNLF